MSTLQELINQKRALEQQITALRSAERDDAVSKVRTLMAQHGLTANDVAGSAPTKRGLTVSGKKVAAKYRDPQTGTTWTGRGLKPRWLTEALAQGKNLGDFSV